MIPESPDLLIHRFWAGKPMPEEYKAYGRLWGELNPGWRVLDWDESALTLVPEELLPVISSLYARDQGRRGIELYVQLADVIGYVLVEQFGGVYVNCDMQPVRSLRNLPEQAWASYENDIGDVVNAVLGAPAPHDPFWQSVLRRLPSKYFANPTVEMVLTTGPSLLTEVARQNPHGIHIYPKEVFNPVHWSLVERGGDASAFLDRLPQETIALHHWGHKKDGRSNCVEVATQ